MTTFTEQHGPWVLTLADSVRDASNPYEIRVINEATFEIEFHELFSGRIAATEFYKRLCKRYEKTAKAIEEELAAKRLAEWRQKVKQEIAESNAELEEQPLFGRFG